MVSTIPDSLTWFCVRRDGVARSSSVPLKNLRKRTKARPSDIVEVSVVEKLDPVDTTQFSRVFCNRVRGILGMEVAFRGKAIRFAPTHMIVTNLSFQRLLESFLEQRGASFDEFSAERQLRSFSARQFLLPDSKKKSP